MKRQIIIDEPQWLATDTCYAEDGSFAIIPLPCQGAAVLTADGAPRRLRGTAEICPNGRVRFRPYSAASIHTPRYTTLVKSRHLRVRQTRKENIIEFRFGRKMDAAAAAMQMHLQMEELEYWLWDSLFEAQA